MSPPQSQSSDPVLQGQALSRNFYQCGTCSQSYTRIDHLARHVRSHTQERPYRCTICDKRFGRIDLLSRHRALHNAQDRERGSKKRRRNTGNAMRVAQACNSCADNHLRCDDEKPCRRCQRKNIECKVPERPVPITSPPNSSERRGSDANEGLAAESNPKSSNTPCPDIQSEAYNTFITPPIQDMEPQLWPSQNQPPFACQKPSTVADIRSPPGTNYSQIVPPEPSDMFLGGMGQPSGTRTPSGLIAFGIETDFDLSALDLDFLESYNTHIPFEFEEFESDPPPSLSPRIHAQEVGRADGKDARSMQRLRWRFVPMPQDHGYAEHENLLLPAEPASNPSPESFVGIDGRIVMDSLDVSSRDKILSIVLSQMRKPVFPPLACFPSLELLDSLIRYFLTVSFSGASSWFHCAGFNPTKTRPELLLAMAAAGAVITPDPSLRKLGYAMQEVIRLHLPTVFEGDNTTIRITELHQAYLLHLEVGLWSGDHRKIEISEGFQQPLITMLRRGGMFHYSAYPPILVRPEDTGKALEEKWETWLKKEKLKRLVYHLFQHVAQLSMALLTCPLISYTEMCLPLPCSMQLWTASSAREWKQLYLEMFPTGTARIPTLTECLANLDQLESNRNVVDINLSCTAVLHTMWGMVWEYRQLSSLLGGYKSRYWDNGLLMTSRYQELTRMLAYFGIGYKNESPLHFHFIQMHMHMSLEEIQLFAASEDPNKACNLPESLRTWSKNKESRQAVWHAGQVIRELKLLPFQGLRNFMAVAIYHASLVLWAYGMASNVQGQSNGSAQVNEITPSSQWKVWLDGDDTEDVQRYIALERGVPALGGLQPDIPSGTLHDPRSVLETILRLMQQNHRHGASVQTPPLVDNLVHLIEKLRDVIK